MKNLINKLRVLKNKPTKDNYFDVALGALLACIGLWLYLNVVNMDKAVIIILPALFSFWNEVINFIDSKKFSIIDVVLRTLIGIVLYFIV